MDITHSPLPVPDSLARLPRIVVAPYGPLLSNSGVALAFGVQVGTLRKWRQTTGFAATVHRQGNVTYYQISDLLPYYYKRFPGELPDPEFDAQMLRARPFAQVTREREEAENGAEEAGASRGQGGIEGLLQRQEEAQERFLLRIGETVTESVGRLVEREPEPVRVIEVQAETIAAQRQEIVELKLRIETLEIDLMVEKCWRDKPLLERMRRA